MHSLFTRTILKHRSVAGGTEEGPGLCDLATSKESLTAASSTTATVWILNAQGVVGPVEQLKLEDNKG